MLAAGLAAVLFLTSERQTVLAGHDATVRPTLSGKVVLHTGPVLPDVRIDSPEPVGVDIVLGKTEVRSLDQLFQRYAVLAAAPQGQRAEVLEAVESMAVSAVVRGAALSLTAIAAGVLLWRLPGAARRRELGLRLWAVGRSRRSMAASGVVVVTVLAVGIALWQPWERQPSLQSDEAAGPVAGQWESLDTFLGGRVRVPDSLRGVQVRGDAYTAQTGKLIDSLMVTYDASKRFYQDVVERVSDLPLYRPGPGETTVLLVSDRHDNIGMDSVARAIGKAAGASAVFDAGDDTSAGARWETFSLDSITAATKGLEHRWASTGNHDHGDTVGRYLAKHGWDVLDGKVVTGPQGSLLLGDSDPQASGVGGAADEKPMTVPESGHRLADIACASREEGKPVATLLVHDPAAGREALRRGCVTLVVAGHLHNHYGPDRVTGTNGHTGWSYTTGTTGGAAISFAMGKLNREAEVSLVTYRDGEPIGVQWVDLEPKGKMTAHPFVPLAAPQKLTPSGESSGAGSSGAGRSASPSRSPSGGASSAR